MPGKKKVFLKDLNWGVFEVSWTPKDYGEIKKRNLAKFLEEHREGFMNVITLANKTLIFRIKGIKKEKENLSSPTFIGRLLTRAQKSLSGENMGSIIDKDTRIRAEDCKIKIFYIYSISGDNTLYPVKRVGTSEKEVLESLNPEKPVVNMKVEKEELKGNMEFSPSLRSCGKNFRWKITIPPPPEPKPKRGKKNSHPGQGKLEF